MRTRGARERRALAHHSIVSEWGGLTELALRRDSLSAESTSVLQLVAVVRATDHAVSLGRFPARQAFLAYWEGGDDSEVLEFLRVGLCTAACTLARGHSTGTGGASERAPPRCSGAGLVPLAAGGGRPPEALRLAKASPRRGPVAGSVCSGSVFGCRSQQEAFGSEKPSWLRPGWGTGA